MSLKKLVTKTLKSGISRMLLQFIYMKVSIATTYPAQKSNIYNICL